MDPPLSPQQGDCTGEPSQVQRKRSICISMKTEQSMDYPVKFKDGKSTPDLSIHRSSNQSIEKPADFKEGQSTTDVSTQEQGSKISSGKSMESIFKELEEKVVSLVKNELKRFKKILSPNYAACCEKEMKYEENQSFICEAALKITLHALKDMNLSKLATTLQKKIGPLYHWKLKTKLKKKFQSINEGISNYRTTAVLNEIYTDLYITEGGSGEVINEHEVRQIETVSRRPATQETPIKCNDLFKDKAIRTVLTKGVAGIGKTVSVQKFILDWADEKANQDVHLIFPLPFRELNLVQEKKFSLIDLLQHFFTETKDLGIKDCDAYNVMFIFDGLDECRLPLDFQKNESLFDVTQSASVDVLLTNLIKGNLLPSALIWITTRPAAANKIPPECVDQVTEVRGFSDDQKEEYFRKKISDQSLAKKIITHIKSSRSLYIMCHIPVFCWIAATVLQSMLGKAEKGEIPKTLTQMYTHFLIYQTKLSQKYQGKGELEADLTKESIMALGKLAFQQLLKGNLIFYEEDLRECGVDVRELSVYSGVCTQIFREEFGLHLGKVFSFVHLSFQEFLAALYVFLSFLTSKRKAFEKDIPGFVSSIKKPTMSDLLKSAIDKALQGENGHLDLFLRFLLGLSLESNQTLLRGLMPQMGSSSHKEDAIKYIKKKIKENPSQEKSINLFHCLNELNDHSLEQEVQTFLCRKGLNRLSTRSGCKHVTDVSLSPAQWSAVVFVLLNSEVDLEKFNLSKYDPSEECFLKLLPVVKESRNANLSGCNLGEKSCAVLASALISTSSNLRELDLSTNNLQDTGVKLLSGGLEHAHCKLEILRLCGCSLTERACTTLSFILKSNTSNLKELNLANNNLQDLGIVQLCPGLQSPHCKLERLGMKNCSITAEGFAALTSAVKSNPSHLRELSLSMNKPGDTGVKLLCELLKDPKANLEKLELCDCCITDEGCAALASALRLNTSHLRDLDVSYNNPRESGVKLLSDLMEDPQCKLEKLQDRRLMQLEEQQDSILTKPCVEVKLEEEEDDDDGDNETGQMDNEDSDDTTKSSQFSGINRMEQLKGEYREDSSLMEQCVSVNVDGPDDDRRNDALETRVHMNHPWPHLSSLFDFKCIKGNSIIMGCQICLPKPVEISAFYTSTSNLRKHVERKHPLKMKDYEECISRKNKRKYDHSHWAALSKQIRIGQVMSMSGGEKRASQEEVDKLVINFICESLQPFSVVDLPSFKALLTTLHPTATVLSGQTVCSRIQEAGAHVRHVITARLRKVEFVAATVDCWTVRQRSYLGVTAHWIDEKTFNRRSAALACKRLKGFHTFEVLVSSLNDILNQYHIRDKVIRITTDSGSNFQKALTVFGEESETEPISFDPEAEDSDEEAEYQDAYTILNSDKGSGYQLPKHQRCACQLLNLVATVDASQAERRSLAYKRLSHSAFSKCCGIWNKAARTTVGAEGENDDFQLQFIKPNQTQWNSHFLAVERVTRIIQKQGEEAVANICAAFQVNMLKSAEIAFLDEYVAVMKPVSSAINVLQCDNNTLMGYLLPTLYQLKVKLMRMEPKCKVCLPLLKALEQGLKKRFGDVMDDAELSAAAILLPRFKTSWAPDSQIIEQGIDYIRRYLETFPKDEEPHKSSSSDEEDFFQSIRLNKPSATDELHGYLACNSDNIALLNSFPYIKNLYLRLNSGLPASAACERLFGCAGPLFTAPCTRTYSDTFENQLLLKLNREYKKE